jgi:arylsulfatase
MGWMIAGVAFMKNVVILLVDALRTKNTSLFGYGRRTDSNMRRIAESSTLFRQYYSTSNATAPAITSILTSLYPSKHGIVHQLPYTKQEEMERVENVRFWFPSFLKERGYETLCVDWVGYWMKKGFDFYGESEGTQQIAERSTPFISSKETVELAISLIKKSKKPFFLFTHFWDTHFPFPNTDYESGSTQEDREKMLASVADEHEREYLRRRLQKSNLNTVKDMTEKYDLAITEIDRNIGRLQEFLIESGIWDDTVFIIMGDHGDNLTDHGIYFNHAGLFDDSIHVPMIMHLPGMKNGEVSELASHVDIVPTLMDYLGLKSEFWQDFSGKSLMPLIRNGTPIRKEVFAFDGLCNDIVAVRTKELKLIVAKDPYCNLCKGSHHAAAEEYDMINDPGETKNIYSKGTPLEKSISSVFD